MKIAYIPITESISLQSENTSEAFKLGMLAGRIKSVQINVGGHPNVREIAVPVETLIEAIIGR